jgi:hypothetical protein
MSILKKLFGHKATGQAAPDTKARSDSNPANRRQSPRIRTTGIRGVSLAIKGVDVVVSTLSIHGVGWNLNAPTQLSLQSEEVLPATLVLDGVEYGLKVELRYQRDLACGARFVSPDIEMVKAIRSKFQAEIVGAQLRSIDSSLLRPEPDGVPLWFQDKAGHEVFVVVDPGKERIIRFRLGYLGHYMEGDEAGGLRSGLIVSDHEVTDPGFSRVYGDDQFGGLAAATADEVSMAVALLSHADAVPNWLRLQLIARIQRGS